MHRRHRGLLSWCGSTLLVVAIMLAHVTAQLGAAFADPLTIDCCCGEHPVGVDCGCPDCPGGVHDADATDDGQAACERARPCGNGGHAGVTPQARLHWISADKAHVQVPPHGFSASPARLTKPARVDIDTFSPPS